MVLLASKEEKKKRKKYYCRQRVKADKEVERKAQRKAIQKARRKEKKEEEARKRLYTPDGKLIYDASEYNKILKKEMLNQPLREIEKKFKLDYHKEFQRRNQIVRKKDNEFLDLISVKGPSKNKSNNSGHEKVYDPSFTWHKWEDDNYEDDEHYDDRAEEKSHDDKFLKDLLLALALAEDEGKEL